MNLSFENGPSLSKGYMRRILNAEREGLGEALRGRPEEAACAGGGILWKGVHQLGYALMKLELYSSNPQVTYYPQIQTLEPLHSLTCISS